MGDENRGTLQPPRLPPVSPSLPGGTYCSGGPDVRTVPPNPRVPSGVAHEIYYDSRSIRARHQRKRPSSHNPHYPSGKVVVIPFTSLDLPPNPHVTETLIRERLFSTTAGVRSVANYFLENSWGQFRATDGGIASWTVLPLLATPARNPAFRTLNHQKYLDSAIQMASGIDWRSFDTDGDGKIARGDVTILFLTPNGDSAITRGDAQAKLRRFTIRDLKLHVDTIVFSVLEPSDPQAASRPFRTFSSLCHEFCHAFFSLRDRYGPNSGTGEYDIMSRDRRWQNVCIYDKMKLGWITPPISYGHRGQCLSFPASAATQAALVLVSPAVTPSGPGAVDASEYWILENRHKASSRGRFDEHLPDQGLAIWWVGRGTGQKDADDVRLVNFSRPDTSPRLYDNPRANALFKLDTSRPIRKLYSRSGHPSYAWIRGVSPPGPVMCAEL